MIEIQQLHKWFDDVTAANGLGGTTAACTIAILLQGSAGLNQHDRLAD